MDVRSFSQQAHTLARSNLQCSYEAYLRYNYDPTGIAGTTYGQPGGPPRCADATGRPASCYHQLDSPGSMVPLSEPLARLGLADSWYRVEPPPAGAAARPVLDLVPYDPWYASDAKSEHAVFGAPACANATVGGRLFVGAGPVWPQVGNGDCANYGHFSVRGLQLMGQRYWDAYARIVGPQQAV